MTTIREADPALADPEQFGAVFDRYFAEIHGYAARRVGRDAAADIAAEVFLTAFRLRRRFDPGRGTVKAWLYGITTNHLSAYRRHEQRAYRAMARAGVPTGLPLAEELRYLNLSAAHPWTAPDQLFSYEIFGPSHWTNANPPVPAR